MTRTLLALTYSLYCAAMIARTDAAYHGFELAVFAGALAVLAGMEVRR